jgi:hypothetical protein
MILVVALNHLLFNTRMDHLLSYGLAKVHAVDEVSAYHQQLQLSTGPAGDRVTPVLTLHWLTGDCKEELGEQ